MPEKRVARMLVLVDGTALPTSGVFLRHGGTRLLW
jgi:hypothetical protein